MSALRMATHQFRYDQRIFWRTPAAVFFTVMLPVIFLLIFASIFGNEQLPPPLSISTSVYYVPGIITLAIVSATLVANAMRVVEARESGRLKRLRSTPMEPSTYILARIGQSLVLSILMLVFVSLIGRILYDVPIPTTTIPALLVTVAVGTFAFSAMGFALTAVIPNEDAAPAITNATVLPLYFLSGVFIPETELPDGVLAFADIFPIRHFFQAFLEAYNPNTVGAGFDWGNLAIVAAWGLVAMAIALKTFRWAPKEG